MKRVGVDIAQPLRCRQQGLLGASPRVMQVGGEQHWALLFMGKILSPHLDVGKRWRELAWLEVRCQGMQLSKLILHGARSHERLGQPHLQRRERRA
jgi:hypothetical protein